MRCTFKNIIFFVFNVKINMLSITKNIYEVKDDNNNYDMILCCLINLICHFVIYFNNKSIMNTEALLRISK